MVIPQSIINSIPKSPLNNNKIMSANSMWKRLSDVYNNKVEFIPYDMATLVNTIELYYKGLIEVSGKEAPEPLMKKSHSLVALTKYIENEIMLLSSPLTFQAKNERYEFLTALHEMYTDARYDFLKVETNTSKSDFDRCYEWAYKQRSLILDTILPPIQEFTGTLKEEEEEYNRELGLTP